MLSDNFQIFLVAVANWSFMNEFTTAQGLHAIMKYTFRSVRDALTGGLCKRIAKKNVNKATKSQITQIFGQQTFCG